jgi:hypothetical protein
MRRFGVIVALGALLGMAGGVATSSPALAGRGHKWVLTQVQPFTLPAAVCGFRLRVAFPVNKGYVKILKSSDGTQITLVTGSLRASYTNLRTGKSITENVSGPGKGTIRPDGSVTVAAKGHNAAFFPPDVAKQYGLPQVGVLAGSLTTSGAAGGSVTTVSFHGHVLLDVCAALS